MGLQRRASVDIFLSQFVYFYLCIYVCFCMSLERVPSVCSCCRGHRGHQIHWTWKPTPNSDWPLIDPISCKPTAGKFIYHEIIFSVNGSSHENHILQPCSILLLLHFLYPLLQWSLGLWNGGINVLLKAVLRIVCSRQSPHSPFLAAKRSFLIKDANSSCLWK